MVTSLTNKAGLTLRRVVKLSGSLCFLPWNTTAFQDWHCLDCPPFSSVDAEGLVSVTHERGVGSTPGIMFVARKVLGEVDTAIILLTTRLT